MLRGLPASVLLHGAVIGLGYVSWPYVSESTRTPEDLMVVPVELVDMGALTNVSAVRTPAPEPEKELQPEPEEDPPEPVEDPEPDPVDETLPEDEIATADPRPEPEPLLEEDILPDFQPDAPDPVDTSPPPTETPTPRRETVDPLAALLNDAESTFASERQTRRSTPPPQPEPVLENVETPQPLRSGAGDRTSNTARLESLLYSQIRGCWDGVDDQPNPETLNVRLQVALDQNGGLRGAIRWLEPSRIPLGRSPMRVAMERARRAVQKCAPFTLPKQEYAEWQTIRVNLGPAFEEGVQ